MQMIARVEARESLRRVFGIANRGFEVEESVVSLAGSNPVVERLTLRLSLGGVGRSTLEGREGGAIDPEASGVSPLDHLLVRGDEVACARRRILPRLADVV